ncbi:sn-glycerol-3-phosphate ABC transporter ATP-binding protein UgpC [Agrobacterium vitis]|uniref:ABC transporter ATP-binding protein n=1 Tax=Agrobacterium vitis TaxID=373 RepID=A0A120D979_AGRVI|nr:sn-glycerol-3-phosphate ABC transporter ATP-binding protein UgpC [Agrobacterium vitis]KAA3509787.1 ABC transporter ATP-binding protein [Agrobacterium vitis]KAA3523409.1 ABC transporter ATP-binding protein [Agrobacterium vitis]MCF1479064.1 sn-glycerol-3-phosphate ABC transporter ATP-binding protein UgpC [Agrobacterium vitis]MUO80274.1 sn-glycerol-3-phosphate ABC transporter ATP-binding protein UgpC [Agrobacterium vitis]MUO94926.1 sn-glycerol-3-phosphate ABC transporter ATP-binding protein Ug
MAVVRIENLRKHYGALEVIHGVDLEVGNGEFLALVGPSGCGKSTFLRMIAGLEEVSGGDIFIDGTRINDLSPRERDIAMVFQNYALYPHMTVAENMGFALKLAGHSAADINTRVAKASEVLGLEPYLKRKPAALSGGQRQRVAMGRAIVRDPKVFLFDEPLSNLDAKLRVQMRSEIRELQKRLKATTVYVTHDQVEAMTMADKIAVFNKGVLEQLGTPLELYHRPANLFVAAFIGSPQMNLVSGEAAQRDGATTIGIRPEHFVLSEDQDAWSGAVVAAECLGSDTFITIDSALYGKLLIRTSGSYEPRIGETISAKPMDGCLHRFDEAGRSI